MIRTGLKVALAIGFVVGLICAVDPQFDLDIAGISFTPKPQMFAVNAQLWVQHSRDAARLVIGLLALPAFLAILGKLILPHRRMLIEGRAALFLIATLALGPGVLTNLVLKDHWHRARPIDVQQFGGAYHFTPWWDPRGDCPNNCSFIAGEPSGAFWTLAPAALAPPELRAVAYGAAIAFGTGIGALRMGAGAHFFSDVVFAGVLMYLVIFAAYGLIYRWPMTRLSEPSIERLLTQAGEALGASLSALTRRIAARTKKSQ
jgi:membrane-associated PAP2 superfamily phosphatase